MVQYARRSTHEENVKPDGRKYIRVEENLPHIGEEIWSLRQRCVHPTGHSNLGLCKKSARFNKVLTHTGKRTYTEIILSIIKKYSAIIFK